MRSRKRFIQPRTSDEAVQEMRDLASPIGAFVREWCRVGAGNSVAIADIFEVWQLWCKEHGNDRGGTQQVFGRDLRAAAFGAAGRRLWERRSWRHWRSEPFEGRLR